MIKPVFVKIDDLYIKNKKIEDFLSGNDYYNYFKIMIEQINNDPTYDFTQSKYYKLCIETQDESLLSSCAYRADICDIMEEYKCNYHDAVIINGLLKKYKINKYQNTFNEKSVVSIIKNYIKLLNKIKNNECIDNLFGIIDEYGIINVLEGFHRCMIYYVCKIPQIRIIIIDRHPVWLSFIKFFELESVTLYKQPKLLYHKINHIDFDDFTVIREERIDVIYDNLIKYNSVNQKGLDLGCFIGRNSHYLAGKGIEMDAVEYEKKYYDVCQMLNKTYNLQVNFHYMDVYSFIETTNNKYDFIIILSLAYHLYRNDKQRATEFLKKLLKLSNVIVIDDEPSTQIFVENDIRLIFNECSINKIFTGVDKRNIYIIQNYLST